jgi:hypothetical protein
MSVLFIRHYSIGVEGAQIIMLEADVVITDWMIALECAGFALWFKRFGSPGVFTYSFTAIFAALALTALIGGVVHGFFPDRSEIGNQILWRMTLLTMGVASGAIWIAAGDLLFGSHIARKFFVPVLIAFVLYAIWVIFISPEFWVAILNYGVASLALLIAFSRDYISKERNAALIGALGMVIALFASLAQRSEMSLPSLGLSHNAIYHLYSIVALAFVFVGARGINHARA